MIAVFDLHRHTTIFEVGADGALGIKLTGLGSFLTQRNARAEPIGQTVDFFAQFVHITVREGVKGAVKQFVDPLIGRLFAHIFSDPLTGKLADLLLHRLLIGLDQLAQLFQPLLAHAHLLHQFHHLFERILHLFEAHGTHHALGHPIAIAQILRTVEAS